MKVQQQGGPFSRAIYTASVTVRQSREFTEPTILSFSSGNRSVQVPIGPFTEAAKFEQFTITPVGDNSWRVEVSQLEFAPEQVAIDPDHVLLDANPGDNVWKSSMRKRVTPVYTMLDETDMTSDFDRSISRLGRGFGAVL